VQEQTIIVAVRVTRALEGLGIPCVICGSLASATYGYMRTTYDADIVADIQPDQVPALVEALSSDFYIDPDAAADAVARGSSFNVIHLATVLKVDVFVCAGDDFCQIEIARSVPQQFGPDTYPLLSPEDTVLAKLLWYRQGGEVSERQWDDVIGVISVQGDRLDQAHLAEWSRRLGVSDLLARALNEGRS
jgi:hypothetical protein